MAGTPKTATAFTELSELLIKQSNPSAEDILLNGLAADLPTEKDIAVLSGSGAAGQPTGINKRLASGLPQDQHSDMPCRRGADRNRCGKRDYQFGNPWLLYDTSGCGRAQGRARLSNADSPVWGRYSPRFN